MSSETLMLKTVKEVVDHLMSDIPDEDIEKVRKTLDRDFGPDEEELDDIRLRISFGRHIRNRYGLWKDNLNLAKDCLRIDSESATATYRMWAEKGELNEIAKSSLMLGEVHPDDASHVINVQFIRRIREEHAGRQR